MKQYHRYRMNFAGKCAGLSALCMGISVFLPVLYYLGANNLEDYSSGTLLLHLWLPVGFGLIYLALLRAIRYDAPGLYAILGAVFCLIHIIGGFSSGSALQAIVETVMYILCAAVLLIVVGGYFPARLPAALMFGIAIIVRLVVFDLGRLSGTAWIVEAGLLFNLAAWMFLPMSLVEAAKKT